MSVLADEPMLMIPASLLQAGGSQTTLPLVHLPTSRIAPPWGKGDPPISVTGVLPRPLRKTRAGGNMWQHTCSLESPEFKDALLIARAKKGSERTPEEHTIMSHALRHEKAQAHASRPAPSVIPSGIMKELILPACVFPSGLGNIPVTEIGGSPFPHGGAILNVGGCPKGSVVSDPTACDDDDDDAGIISICSSTSTNVLALSGKKPP